MDLFIFDEVLEVDTALLFWNFHYIGKTEEDMI